MHVVEYLSDDFDFAISSPKVEFQDKIINPRKPGAIQHIAFKAESRVKL